MDGTAEVRRLALRAAEWSLLCQAAGMDPPAGFGPHEAVPQPARDGAQASLRQRGVLTDSGPDDAHVHRSVLANLTILTDPDAVVRLDMSVRDHGLRAGFALRGPLGASLVTLADQGVELSMFAAANLATEIARTVPPKPVAETGGTPIATALSGELSPPPPLRGRLPLSALAEYGVTSQFAADVSAQFALSPDEAALAAAVTARTYGLLRGVVGGGPRATAAHGQVLAAQVIWLATDAGWVGLQPRPDGSGRQLVELVPVGHDAIGAWLAPYLTPILELVGD